MLRISHSQINVWDSRHPAVRTSYQDCTSPWLSLFPSPSMVQSHFCREIGAICAPHPMISPQPKANNKQQKLCHLSLHCCPSTWRRRVAALPWGAAGFVSQLPLPSASYCPPTAKVHGWAGKPHGHWSLCKAWGHPWQMYLNSARGDSEERNK